MLTVTFTSADLPEWAIETLGEKGAEEWLAANAKHIEEAVCHTALDAIDTFLMLDGIEPSDDE